MLIKFGQAVILIKNYVYEPKNACKKKYYVIYS